MIFQVKTRIFGRYLEIWTCVQSPESDFFDRTVGPQSMLEFPLKLILVNFEAKWPNVDFSLRTDFGGSNRPIFAHKMSKEEL